MPSLADLLDPNKYGLEPEVAFLLYRPVLSRVPFPAPPSAKDEEDGEIPEGDQVPMEVEQGETRSDHARHCVWCKVFLSCCTVWTLLWAGSVWDVQGHVIRGVAVS